MSDVFVLDRENGCIRRYSQEVTGEPWWTPSIGPALGWCGAGDCLFIALR